jgi:hypothetical protein
MPRLSPIGKYCFVNLNKREKPPMRFMIIVKATKDSESGPELLKDMGKFNQDLIDAGIFVAADGLQASSKGARVTFAGQDRIVTMGPFPETKDLVAGYWIWNMKSIDEAIEWVNRCPNPMPGPSDIEIRQVFEAEDFT